MNLTSRLGLAALMMVGAITILGRGLSGRWAVWSGSLVGVLGGATSGDEPAAGKDLSPAALAQAAMPGSVVGGEEYYVASDGSPDGDGSKERPWNLAKILEHPPAAIEPGDVVSLRGGVYRGTFVSHLQGSQDAPITVRALPGERVQLDLYNPDKWEQAFFVLGDHVVYQGFEVTTSSPGPRVTNQSGPFQTDVKRGGIAVRGHHNKFINLVVHDLNAGIGYWGDGGEIHGSIVYNNGWKGPDRQHGHGLYLQNDRGLKSITDNILFNQFGAGIHAYGSDRARLNDLHFEGNVAFNNGAGVGEGYAPERDILVGGGAVIRNARLHQNFTFQSQLYGAVDLGFLWGPENEDVTITNNYFVGTVRFLQPFNQVVFTGNTIVGGQSAWLKLPADGVIDDYHWDHNLYTSRDDRVLFLLGTAPLALDSWRQQTGLDADSRLASLATAPEVFVRPNKYEAGRANVIVYNWGEAPQVELDLSQVLQQGDRYELVSALDFYGEPILRGTFAGEKLQLPMTARPAPSPLGYPEAEPVAMDSRFGAFVVRTVGAGGLVSGPGSPGSGVAD
jgi:hypothetical protein